MFEDSASLMPSIWASMNSWFTPTVLFVLLNLVIGTIAITSSLAAQKPHSHSDDQQQRSSSSSSSSSSSHQLGRSPSALQRLRSINFYSYRSQEPTTSFHKSPETETSFSYGHEHEGQSSGFVRSPSVLQRLKSINLYSYVISKPEPEPELRRERTPEPETPPREEEERFDGDGDGAEDEDEDDRAESLDEVYSKLKGSGHVGRSKSDATGEATPVAEMRARRMRKSASAKAPAARAEESTEAVEARRPATVREARATAAEEDDEEVDARADDFINKFKQQLKLQRLDSILRARS